jgi:tRNA G18 (ribose-2'-O)-methylase SpoU
MQMPVQTIHSLSDPQLAAYRNLKDKELARDGHRFIAEGENVVRRLLASSTPVESVLLAERKVSAIAPLCRENVTIFVASDDLIQQIIGFEFHSGVLACGIRPPAPALEALIPPSPAPALLTICQQITNAENLGSLIRISAAFGASAIILGQRCCDPWFRQCVRVSMGTIFALPIFRSTDLLSDLDAIKSHGITCLAAVIDNDAVPLDSIERISRVGLVFGSEAQGLDPATIGRCDRRVTIPMRLGTDSLNVAIAAAVFLYQLTRDRTF